MDQKNGSVLDPKRLEITEFSRLGEDFCVNSKTNANASFFVIECSDWVNVIPVTTDGKVIVIEQFRQGIEEITLEIPGGMVDKEESPLETAGERT